MDVAAAAESGDRRTLNRAIKMRLATAMDDPRAHPRDLDSLVRGLLGIIRAEMRPPSPVPAPRRRATLAAVPSVD